MLTIWVVDLDAPGWQADSHAELLEAGERSRASRFAHRRDAARWQASRSALRLLLGDALGADARLLRITQDEKSRPHLVDYPDTPFSLTHSDAVALIALGGSSPLGIDVERLREIPDRAAIADRCFTPRERQAPEPANADVLESSAAFLRQWTRKEALLKALGLGVQAIQQIEVQAGSGAARVTSRGPSDRDPNWKVLDLTPVAGYVGAVACAQADSSVTMKTFPPPPIARH